MRRPRRRPPAPAAHDHRGAARAAPARLRYDLGLKGPDEASLDRSAAPCDDFYEFACGGWMKATPIPDDEASWVRSFSVIHEDNQKTLRAILDRDAQGDTRGDAYAPQLGDLWASCMDEEGIEKRALDELKPELKRIDAIRDPRRSSTRSRTFTRIGVGAAFGFDSEIDFKDATMQHCRRLAGRPGAARARLLLPRRRAHEGHPRSLRGATSRGRRAHRRDAQGGRGDAKTVVKVETQLAGASMMRVGAPRPARRSTTASTSAGLKSWRRTSAWDSYLGGLGFPGLTAFNVAQPDFVKQSTR